MLKCTVSKVHQHVDEHVDLGLLLEVFAQQSRVGLARDVAQNGVAVGAPPPHNHNSTIISPSNSTKLISEVLTFV
jgi:hypothetical protein